MIEILSTVYDSDPDIYNKNFKDQQEIVLKYCNQIIEEQCALFEKTKTPLYASNKIKFTLGKFINIYPNS